MIDTRAGGMRGLIRALRHRNYDIFTTLFTIASFLALLFCMVPISAQAQTQPPTGFPATINETEDNGAFSGTWTWNGSGYNGTWGNGAVAVLTTSTPFNANASVTLNRSDSTGASAGLTAVYTGTVSAQGNSITNGSVTWTWPGHNGYPVTGNWSASWSTTTVPVTPAFTKTFTVIPGVQVQAVAVWDINTFTCQLLTTGSFTLVAAPQHGSWSSAVVSEALPAGDPCAGQSFPASVAYYTWNANDTSGATTDTFSLQWTASDGSASEIIALIAQIQKPTITLNLVSPFLLAQYDLGNDLTNIDPTVLYTQQNWSQVQALGLSADNTSAAIAVVQLSTANDVTLTTDNETTLVYNPGGFPTGFLSTPPSPGQTSVTISAANLVKVGNFYYAAVLVQAPATGNTSFSLSDPITVTAAQSGATQQSATMYLVTPPIILVHGIWGNASSLQNLYDYLTGVTQTNYISPPDLMVNTMCYSPSLRFDASTDPVVSTNPCEVTSANALQIAINSDMGALDSLHVVGGRVDIVAHSMGGLAARHYAALPTYQQLRNRNQGQFHQVITLDTPELGSTLANYLISVAHRTRRAKLFSEPGLVWSSLCGTSLSVTVAECLAANDEPLSPPGLPFTYGVTQGAVYSLFPNGPALNPSDLSTLSGPNISNAIWHAISAQAPGNGADGVATNDLIQALVVNPSNADSVDSILGTRANDGIVTLQSQTAGATSGQFYTFTFPKLSHNSLPKKILDKLYVLYEHLNDNSVVNDPTGRVNALVGCWLENPFGQGCAPSLVAASVAGALDAPGVSGEVTNETSINVVDGLNVSGPNIVKLATPFTLTIKVSSSGSLQGGVFVVQQSDQAGRFLDREVLSAQRGIGNTFNVTVLPRLLGVVTFDVSASFSNGDVSNQQFTTNVVPPAAPPQLFTAEMSGLNVVVLDPTPSGSIAKLHPQAYYASIPDRIDAAGIPHHVMLDVDPSFVKFSLVPQQGQPAVFLNRYGEIDALRPGRAVVEAQFGTAIARVQVIVKPQEPLRKR